MPHISMTEIWDKDGLERLTNLVKQVGVYKTAARDSTSAIESIGEDMALNAEGGCDHPYFLPNQNNTKCVLPSRIDVGRHFILTGGVNGAREKYDQLLTRTLPFSSFIFDRLQSDPDVKYLFESDFYKKYASEICGGRTVFDPIQLSIIINIPGQKVPLHYDVPWFTGASRFTLPQWLTVVMATSGLFDDIRLPQVQGVAYLHQWENSDYTDRGGNFFYYPEGGNGKVLRVHPTFNTAIMLDGSYVLHGTDTFQEDAVPPPLEKSKTNLLKYVDDDTWKVYIDDEEVGSYHTKDLRISLVWRQRCFHSQEELINWRNAQNLTLDEVLDTLEQDLIKRGKISERPKEPLDFAILLMDEYIKMPLPEKLFPYNYCAADRLLPWTKPLIDLIC